MLSNYWPNACSNWFFALSILHLRSCACTAMVSLNSKLNSRILLCKTLNSVIDDVTIIFSCFKNNFSGFKKGKKWVFWGKNEASKTPPWGGRPSLVGPLPRRNEVVRRASCALRERGCAALCAARAISSPSQSTKWTNLRKKLSQNKGVSWWKKT